MPDGSPDTNPALTNPANCDRRQLQPNPGFIPLLGCYDLTEPRPCPRPTAARLDQRRYNFYGHANIQELALYVQDTITIKNWTFNLGVRFDDYDGITKAAQGEPRLGIAYNIKPTNTVLRVSYARTMETPFNENLVLASIGCNDPVINAHHVATRHAVHHIDAAQSRPPQ